MVHKILQFFLMQPLLTTSLQSHCRQDNTYEITYIFEESAEAESKMPAVTLQDNAHNRPTNLTKSNKIVVIKIK